MARSQIQFPSTQFKRAYLVKTIIETMNKCGIGRTANYQQLCGGIIGQIEIDGHSYTAEVETIAEAILDVNDKHEFVEAIESIAIVDDPCTWRQL